MLDVAEADVETVVDELRALGLEARPSAFHRGTIACTGIEFCKLAIVETKGRAESIRHRARAAAARLRHPDHDQRQRLPELVRPVPGRRHRLQGRQLQKAADGEDVEAFQVHLGGQLGTEAAFGRKFRGLKVTADEAADYAERVLVGFQQRRTDGESFASYVARADEDWLLLSRVRTR